MEGDDDQQKKPKARAKADEEEQAAAKASSTRHQARSSGMSERVPDAMHIVASNDPSRSADSAAAKDGPKSKDSSVAKLPAAMLDATALEKRRADNRRHAAASRKRNRETQDRLIEQTNALEKDVFEEKKTNLLLRQRMLNAWQIQQNLLQANGVAPIPIPAILGTVPPSLDRTGRSPREMPGYPIRRRRRPANKTPPPPSSEEEDSNRGGDKE